LRLKAAEKLGIAEVPVILCDDWSDAQVKTFRLLVNRSVTWADWDMELLSLELTEAMFMGRGPMPARQPGRSSRPSWSRPSLLGERLAPLELTASIPGISSLPKTQVSHTLNRTRASDYLRVVAQV
jgi:hypothetical protein